jgi:hypothetical protein
VTRVLDTRGVLSRTLDITIRRETVVGGRLWLAGAGPGRPSAGGRAVSGPIRSRWIVLLASSMANEGEERERHEGPHHRGGG